MTSIPHRTQQRRRGGPRAARPPGLAVAVVLVMAWSAAGLGTAAAHGTLIRGSLTLAPDPPRPGQPMVLTIELANTRDNPVEGAKLAAVLTAEAPAGSGATVKPLTIPLQEYQEPYGTYRAELAAPTAGSYTLTVHDRTNPGEDTTASVPLRIGGNVANGTRGFTFPGSAQGSSSVTTWLAWLIGVPLVVGIVVTILVRRSSQGPAEPDQGGH